MIGGIYCEATLGFIVDNGLILSVRQGMKNLFGDKDIIPKGDTFNEQIINYWYNDISKKMGKILSSWKYPTNRGYFNRTVDLTRSICLGIYYNGKLKRMYRFTGGKRERTAFSPSENASVKDTIRMEDYSRTSHPNPASRAKEFLDKYETIGKKGFSIVIAATMPYAVRLEHNGSIGGIYRGYNIPVLKHVVNRMLASVYDFKKENKSGVFYGYVFESTGQYES